MITTQTTIIPVKQQSAGAVRSLTAQVQAQSRGQESEKSLQLLAKQTSNLQSQINSLVGILKKTPMPTSVLNSAGTLVTSVVVTNPTSPYTPNVAAGGDFTFEITINANLIINLPNGAKATQRFRFRIIPDGTHIATFDAGYIGAANYGMDPASGTYSDFFFECRNSDAKPALASRPLTGITWP